MKSVKRFWVFMLVLGFVVPAFASNTQVNHGGVASTPAVVAAEILGVTRGITITGAANNVTLPEVALGFQLGQGLAASSILNLTFAGGGAFQAVPYFICAPEDTAANQTVALALEVGQATPSLNATQWNFAINTTAANALISTGTVFYVTNVGCGNVANNSSVNVNVLTTNSRLVTVIGGITLGGTSIDPSPRAANTVQVVNEFVPALSAAENIAIDYLGTPFDGTHFPTAVASSNVIAVGSNKIATTKSGVLDYNTNSAPNSAGITLGQTLTLYDLQQNWQGVTRVFTTGNIGAGACNVELTPAANITAAVNGPTGAVLLPQTGAAAFNGSATNNVTVCFQVAGNTPLNRRIITGDYSYTASTTGGVPPSGATAQNIQFWAPNGYQALNPYMYAGTDDASDVFVRFSNNFSRDALVFVEVWSGSTILPTVYPLANVPAGGSTLYWSRNIAALAGLPTGSSYSARFTVTAPPGNIDGVSFMKRASGERSMPLYKNDPFTTYNVE